MTNQRRSERLTDPTPTHTTPEPISPAYGHAAAVKRPSPPNGRPEVNDKPTRTSRERRATETAARIAAWLCVILLTATVVALIAGLWLGWKLFVVAGILGALSLWGAATLSSLGKELKAGSDE